MTYNEWKAKFIKNETDNPAQNLFNAFNRWMNKTPAAWGSYLALPKDESGHINLGLNDVFAILEAHGVEFPTSNKGD